MGKMCKKNIVLAGVCGGLAMMVTVPACLITHTPQFLPPDHVQPEGSCMCSVCWNQPFCWDPSLPEGMQFYGSPPCDKTEHEAALASRVVSSVQPKEGGFFCWAPSSNAIMDFPQLECPTTPEDRAKAENLDPCVDLPACAVPVAQCGGPTPDPVCPEVSQTARRTACVPVPGYDPDQPEVAEAVGASVAVDAAALNCALHGKDPPSGPQPERYCYLSCVSAETCKLDSEPQRCIGCGGDGWYHIESAGTGDAFPADFEDAVITVLTRDADDTFREIDKSAASGSIRFQVPASCQGPNADAECPATMTRVSLAAKSPLTLVDREVPDVRFINGDPASGTFVTHDSEGELMMRSPVRFSLTGTGGDYVYADLLTTSPIVTQWDWAARRVALDMTLVSNDGRLAFVIQGRGRFDSLPPTSVATASQTPFGRSIILSAEMSVDPDGPADIQSVTWTSEREGVIWQASGTRVVVTPSPGRHRYYAKVTDSSACTHTSYLDVRVDER